MQHFDMKNAQSQSKCCINVENEAVLFVNAYQFNDKDQGTVSRDVTCLTSTVSQFLWDV